MYVKVTKHYMTIMHSWWVTTYCAKKSLLLKQYIFSFGIDSMDFSQSNTGATLYNGGLNNFIWSGLEWFMSNNIKDFVAKFLINIAKTPHFNVITWGTTKYILQVYNISDRHLVRFSTIDRRLYMRIPDLICDLSRNIISNFGVADRHVCVYIGGCACLWSAFTCVYG